MDAMVVSAGESEDEWDEVSVTSALTSTSWVDVDVQDEAQRFRHHHQVEVSSAAGSVAALSDLTAFELDMPTAEELGLAEDAAGAEERSQEDARSVGSSQLSQCPLTLDRMRDPTLCLVDGKVYERVAIEQWVKLNGTSPFTREPVTLEQLKVLPRRRVVVEDDEDDAKSISTQNGWPRVHRRALPSQELPSPLRAGSPTSPAAGASYLEMLLHGGGGLGGNRAQSLSEPRRSQRVAPQSMPLRPPRDTAHRRKRRQTNGGGEDEDISDLVDEEWAARKGRVGRWKGRLMVSRLRRSGAYGGLHIPAPQPNLPTLHEDVFAEEQELDDGEGLLYDCDE
uniref:U-box domain-containing protein n=1 Tax=Rhizochromulina marina TaxID=1034831 RepID=A0A7S2WFY7_9STRA|mmetsp:Transcript_22718/g.66147  ORF Transcript_22718/g.66147 Transcript_22718/m.66147 type:complete len:338 (+) Transcript_22718:25-1038(+)